LSVDRSRQKCVGIDEHNHILHIRAAHVYLYRLRYFRCGCSSSNLADDTMLADTFLESDFG